VLHSPILHVEIAASPSAYYIDALAHPTFSPTRLHAHLTAQHRRECAAPRFTHKGYMYAAAPAAKPYGEETLQQAEQALKARADEAMERVALLRVFDFEGLLEAVGEVDVAITEMTARTIGSDAKEFGEVEGAAGGSEPERSRDFERESKRRRLGGSPLGGCERQRMVITLPQ